MAIGKSWQPRHWACPGGSTASALLASSGKSTTVSNPVVQKPLNHRDELGGGVYLALPFAIGPELTGRQPVLQTREDYLDRRYTNSGGNV